MTVNVQPTLEGQVKIYGAEAERMRMASERLRMSVDQFIEYAIKQLVQETLEDEIVYDLKVRPEVKRLRELLAQSDATDAQDEAELKAALENYKPLSEEASLALAKRLAKGGVSSLDVIKEREEGW